MGGDTRTSGIRFLTKKFLFTCADILIAAESCLMLMLRPKYILTPLWGVLPDRIRVCVKRKRAMRSADLVGDVVF